MDLYLNKFVSKWIYIWNGFHLVIYVFFQVPSGPWDRNHYWDGFVLWTNSVRPPTDFFHQHVLREQSGLHTFSFFPIAPLA